MSKSLVGLLVLLVAAGGYLGYVIATKRIPCVTPIRYQVAELDSKFGLSSSEVDAEVAQAAKVWNTALGKDVLVVGDKPDLPIYFQYTSTQRTVDTIESINADIDALKIRQNKVANEYAAGQKQGMSEQELKPLLDEYYQIKSQIDADIARGRQIPSGEVKEGRYISDEQGTRVYIYGYQNKTQRMRVLIHEFGHALGLEHVKNSDSIMYESNDSTNLTLTAEDRAELAHACTL